MSETLETIGAVFLALLMIVGGGLAYLAIAAWFTILPAIGVLYLLGWLA